MLAWIDIYITEGYLFLWQRYGLSDFMAAYQRQKHIMVITVHILNSAHNCNAVLLTHRENGTPTSKVRNCNYVHMVVNNVHTFTNDHYKFTNDHDIIAVRCCV